MRQVAEVRAKAQASEGSAFSEHFVLYLDFLGISDAAASGPGERASRLIDVLRTLAASRASFSMDGGAQPDGSYKISATAETSTFSDHIVASFPIPQGLEIPEELVIDMYLSLVQDMVGRIAVHALNVGLLVRGGLTIGNLYHSDGVVFGEAMVDAFRLESRVAVYPRVAVSSRIYAKVPPEKRERILQDVDGIWHLDYFTKLLKTFPAAEHKPWIDYCQKMIDHNIASFETAEKWNEFSKWSWFKRNFCQYVGAW